jgi:uncharacterized protein YnzC (UPF0291/DUF896 family)
MLMMNMDEFERLNTLVEKAMNESATRNELKELNELLNDWNSSVELNFFNHLL